MRENVSPFTYSAGCQLVQNSDTEIKCFITNGQIEMNFCMKGFNLHNETAYISCGLNGSLTHVDSDESWPLLLFFNQISSLTKINHAFFVGYLCIQ